MAKSAQFSETLALGKTLVQQFSSDEFSADLSTRWMAHYLAGLIQDVENESAPAKRKKLQQECADVILKLWEKRSSFPGQSAPLGRLADAISVLSVLSDLTRPALWRRFASYETEDRWGRFMQQMRMNFEQIINLALIVNVMEPALIQEKLWLKHGKFLSGEEKKFIERLDQLISRTTGPRIFIVSDPKAKDTPRLDYVLDRMKELVQNQLKTLEELRSTIPEILIPSGKRVNLKSKTAKRKTAKPARSSRPAKKSRKKQK